MFFVLNPFFVQSLPHCNTFVGLFDVLRMEDLFLHWGWLVYFCGSVGFLLADSLANVVPDWLYLFLGLVFVVDAFLYLMAWRTTLAPKIDVWLWSELVNVAASVFCAVAAGLFMMEWPRDSALAAQVNKQKQKQTQKKKKETEFFSADFFDASKRVVFHWNDSLFPECPDVSVHVSAQSFGSSSSRSFFSCRMFQRCSWRGILGHECVAACVARTARPAAR
jgi:hypothetical protein